MRDQKLSKAFYAATLFAISGMGLGCGVSRELTLAPPGTSIASTRNPLVARYYMSAACAGQAMVEFGTDTSYGRSTSWQPIPGKHATVNFLVAGMRASTTYHMRATLECSGATVTSAAPDVYDRRASVDSVSFDFGRASGHCARVPGKSGDRAGEYLRARNPRSSRRSSQIATAIPSGITTLALPMATRPTP
jgi:hypothetical protein